MDDAQFTAMETLKCPIIALINLILMKNRCTRAVAGLWGPLALLKQFISTTNSYQRPKSGHAMSIGDYKRTVESNLATTCQMAGNFVFGTVLMQPFLDADGITLAQYNALAPTGQLPYNIDIMRTL